jgi:serine acetyltransferase
MNNILKFLRLPWHDLWNVLQGALVELKTYIYYSRIFGKVGRKSRIYKPILLANPRYVFVGDHTLIRTGARIETLQSSARRIPCLRIGDRTNIEQNVHIVCHNRISIGSFVSITANCAIVDTTHPVSHINAGMKVGDLIADDDGFVEIGDGTFIGIGTVILPNVRIGRMCYIGANSVVTQSIPDFSVAAGSPARIIRTREIPGH